MQSFTSHFATLQDPRVDRCKKHLLSDILLLTVAAVLCGADDWNEIEEFGHYKEAWLRKHCALPNGIPSHDTLNRVFAALDPQEFSQCFMSWIKCAAPLSAGEIVSLDGKRLCGSGQGGCKDVIHMVGAWACSSRLMLGQEKVDGKSNEITAIPALLDALDLTGCILTIDAMGCQRSVADKIIGKGADYVLSLKSNQAALHEEAMNAFAKAGAAEAWDDFDIGHGRIEKRRCSVLTDLDWIAESEKWKGIRSVIRIEAERTDKKTGKAVRQERYYISSLAGDAQKLSHVIRSHWGIENQLHWTLDVVFGEDRSQKRAGNAAQNFSLITRIALNILKNFDDRKGKQNTSLKIKRKKAAWNDSYLETLLQSATAL